MKGHPKSYLDPAYDRIEAAIASKLGLPEGLLTAIRTKGERSDADQVSSSGARTVYQVIPATRRAALKKWGVDAWASAENAAEVAGLILKDSLTATKGDATEAVARYHAGTEGARGSVNRAYVARVTGQGGEPASAGRSTSRVAVAPPRVVEAYNAGTMSATDKAAFDKALKAGQVRLPDGASLTSAPTKVDPGVAVVPARVLQNYTNHSDMTDAQRDLIDRDVAAGNLRLPEGAKLTRPGPRTAADYGGMAGRAIARGVGGLADQIGTALNPVGGAQNMLRGAVQLADVVNPVDGSADRLKGSIAQQPMTTQLNRAVRASDAAGLAMPATSGEQLLSAGIEGGVQGAILSPIGGARTAVGRLITETGAGAASGVSADAARQAGGGEVAQLAAGVIGGGLPTLAAARLTERFGPKVVAVLETTPRETLIGPDGNFTEAGHDIIRRAGAEPEAVKAVIEEAEGGAGTTTPEPVPVGRPAGDVALTEAPVAAVVDDVSAAPAAQPEAPLPATAAARVADARAEGVDLTKAQATRDFGAAAQQQEVAAMPGPEGDAVRAFETKQKAATVAAVDRFKEAFSDTTIDATTRGEKLRDIANELRDQDKTGVDALYGLAREIGGEDLALNTKGLMDTAKRALVAADVPDAVKGVIREQLAMHGLLGKVASTAEDGLSTVKLSDGRKVQFYGEPRVLNAANADEFRKAISAQYSVDGPQKVSQTLKFAIDDALTEAFQKASDRGGNEGQAWSKARSAASEFAQTYRSKGLIPDIIEGRLAPELMMQKLFAGGKDGYTNLKKARAYFLSKGRRDAWSLIQGHGLALIFDKAVSPDATSISGLALNRSIKNFGPEKAKVLLGDDGFNSLMRLQRVIGDVTIPIPRTTNPSGSGHAVIRYFAQRAQALAPALKIAPIVGPSIDAAEKFAATQSAKRTVKDVAGFTPEAAAKADAPPQARAATPAPDPQTFVRDLMTLLKSDALITPIAASSAASQKEGDQ